MFAMSGEKNGVRINSLADVEGPSSSNWPAKIRASSGEKLKNWAAVLMGVAALVTAGGTYIKPADDTKTRSTYEEIRREIGEMSKDIKNVSQDVEFLYQVRISDEKQRHDAFDKEAKMQEEEDSYIEQFLAKKNGSKAAKDYIDKRKLERKKLRVLFKVSSDKRELARPPTTRNLPSYDAVPQTSASAGAPNTNDGGSSRPSVNK
jgi:hypothetical protein